MAIRVIQLGIPRDRNEGIRVGTVRRPPRGVSKADYARLDYYDIWLPQLAPSAELIKLAKAGRDNSSIWKRFEKRYIHELTSHDNLRLLDFLSALSLRTDISLGCYCKDESKCHRSILKKVLAERGALIK
jgi:uncharacterized protein YeaO (DUF488 family)